MRLKGLDLNLLIALDVLLEEQNVSRSAERLHLSQPAASAALGRLRDYFKDELLVLHGKRMMLTPYARTLAPEVKRVLAQVDGLISMSNNFDPALSDRTFTLLASDFITAVVITPVLPVLQRIAPNIKLDIRLPGERALVDFERGEIDLMLYPESVMLPNHPAELLFEENYVVVGWNQNPIFDQPMTEQVFLDSAHVAVTVGSSRELAYAERQMATQGIERQIDIYAPSFSLVPWLLLGTNRLAVIQQRFAHMVVPVMPLCSAPLPVAIPPMREMVQYHGSRKADKGIAWLRGLLREHGAGPSLR